MSAANDNPAKLKPQPDPLAYGVTDAARAVGVGKSTVWRWIAEGKVKTIKLGCRTVIRREELARLLDDAA